MSTKTNHFRFKVIKNEKEDGVVSITKELADTLNDNENGIKYVLEDEKAVKVINFEDVEYPLHNVIDAYNSLEGIKVIAKNTGVAKTIERVKELTEEQEIVFLKELQK